MKCRYKWVVLSLCILMVFTCLGFCSSTKSLYLNAITQALGMSRGLFSINDSCRFITTAIISFFFGNLISKFGAKKLIFAGFLSLICSCIVYSFASNIFMFCLGGILLGVGLAWTTTTMVSSIITKWFKHNKGTAMGLVLASNGLGGALATSILTPIIYSDVFGYKSSYRLVALILAVVGALILIFIKESPEKKKESDVSEKKKNRSDIKYSDIFKNKYVYPILIFIFFTGFILQSSSGVAAAHMKDAGLDASSLALVMSIHSISLTAFKLLVGVIYDKFGIRITTLICYSASVLSLLSLIFFTPVGPGRSLAFIYGIISSLALPLETIMLPIYTAALFDEKSFNKMLGLITSANVTGYALGAPCVNFYYDIVGNYKGFFITCIILIVLVTALVQYVITVNNKTKKATEF